MKLLYTLIILFAFSFAITDKIITDFNEISEVKYLGVYKGKIYYKYYDVGREVKYPKVIDCSKVKIVCLFSSL